MFTPDNLDYFINHFDLINKLQDSVRVDLNSIKTQIEDFLKDDSFKDMVKSKLKHPQVKTRLFCYKLLKERIVNDETIITLEVNNRMLELWVKLYWLPERFTLWFLFTNIFINAGIFR